MREAGTGRLWRGLSRHRPKLVLALRMTASSLAAFALAIALGLPQGFWAVITALVVTESSVGNSLKAAFDRFAGSVFGALYGSAIALAIPYVGGLSRAAALAIAVAPLSVVAAFSAGFRVAPITAIILLFSVTSPDLGPLDFAVSRVLEVGLGCAVGLVVSLLVVPDRASRLVRDAAAQVAQLLAEQLEALALPGEQARRDLGCLAVKARLGLNKLEVLVGEAARERRSRLTDVPDPDPLFRSLVRLRHDLVMLRRFVRGPWHDAVRDHLAQPWSRAARTGAALLGTLGQALDGQHAPVRFGAMDEAIGAYRAAVDEVRRRGLTYPLPTDTVGRLFGIGFALEQFRQDLDDLAERTRELSTRRERRAWDVAGGRRQNRMPV